MYGALFELLASRIKHHFDSLQVNVSTQIIKRIKMLILAQSSVRAVSYDS